MHKIILFGVVLLLALMVQGQVAPDSVEQYLNRKAAEYPALNSRLDISVSEVSLDEFLRAIAVANKLNFDIADNLDDKVVNNFTGVLVKDMLAFICKQYNLTLGFTGTIISIRKNPTIKNSYIAKQSDISFDAESQTITFNLKNDSLVLVAEQITRLTGTNVVLAPALQQKLVTGYIQNKPLDAALDKLAFANNLTVTITNDGFFLLEPDPTEAAMNNTQNIDPTGRNRVTAGRSGNNQGKESTGMIDVKKTGDGKVTVTAENFPLSEFIKRISDELKVNYFIVSKMDDPISLQLRDAGYDEILNHLFAGTKYMFKKTDRYYVIGDRTSQEIKETRVITLKNRAVDKLLEELPKDILKDIEAKEFPELNSILVNGPQTLIDDFEQFMAKIDQSVPVILIEVMIVYVSKSKGISTGISAGIGETTTTTKGTLNPGLSLDVGASTLNNLINSFNGFGWLNLSELHPNFYLQLKALEEAGFLDITSTPRLSTLNGHEAKMSIGNTEYYQEEQTNIIGTQNPQTTTTTSYKSVKADLSVTILPIVSGDENITLQVSVKQSDFTEKISKYAPPNTVDRSFESTIRIKNGEMILLGGLEENEKEESSSGWPILSRIPIVKWFFSSRSKSDSHSKLNIFIKPTIIP